MDEEDVSAGPYTADSVFNLDNALYRQTKDGFRSASGFPIMAE